MNPAAPVTSTRMAIQFNTLASPMQEADPEPHELAALPSRAPAAGWETGEKSPETPVTARAIGRALEPAGAATDGCACGRAGPAG